MSDVVIHAEGLSKQYRIGERERYLALRDVLTRALAAPLRLFHGRSGQGAVADQESSMVNSQSQITNHQSPMARPPAPSTIWALKDVSFEIRQGEVVGIIGRNGAGKTTLLKILARVTKPTAGYADVRGRMGSLLEVGTGFHPELTGRENTFLSGAILGMSKVEIQRKFDEIVAFSEVEKFIDTPLKYYSTGMQTRLAFAVAAHLEPEILLVDEVLSVGDIEFQKKCLGKMGDVAKAGRTILFVSHQMNQIRRLCERVVWVESGRIRCDGPAAAVVASYEAAAGAAREHEKAQGQSANGKAQFEAWEITDPAAGQPNRLETHGPITITFRVHAARSLTNLHHGVALYNSDRQLLWGTATDGLDLSPGRNDLSYWLSGLPLKPGPYTWRVTLFDEFGLIDDWECLPQMVVTTRPLGHRADEWAGVLNLPYTLTASLSQRGAGISHGG